ncbi:MAG: TetR/AcrR family transcriptional regulator, partial [Polyangia bacterium]
ALADAPLDLLVRRMVMLMLDAHAVDPELHRVLNEQVPRVGRLHRVHEVEARMQRLGRAWFERRRGELRPGLDLDTAAFVVVQTIEALTHGAMIHGETAPPRDALVEEISTLVLRYLAP